MTTTTPTAASAAPPVAAPSTAALDDVADVPVQTAGWATVLLGALGLVVMCPLIQWLEIGTDDKNSLSSGAVPPVPVLVITGLVLSAALAWALKRVQPRANFVLLYAMLMVGATICSTGVVRPIYGSLASVMHELLQYGVTTVRRGYETQDGRFFPHLDRPLIADDATEKEREKAYGPLFTYGKGLDREPDEAAPRAAHPLARYDTTRVVEAVDPKTGKTTQARVPKGYLESAAVRLDFWWNERFMHDVFGVKGPAQVERERVAAEKAAAAKMPAPAPGEVTGVPWRPWVWPMVNWSVFYLLVIGFLFAMAEVLRRIWLRIENLSVPLSEVPNGLLGLLPGNPGGRPGSRVPTLIGMAIGAAWVSVFAAGHFKLGPFAGITSTYQLIDLTPAFRDPPLKEAGTVQFYYSPMLIALGCLLSLEISRSIWSMSVGMMAALIVLGAMGISGSTTSQPLQVSKFSYSSFPYWEDQCAGAMVILSLWLLWAARRRLWDILSALWKPVGAKKVGDAFIHPKVLPVLLIGLLVAMPAYAWFMGLTSVSFIVIVFGLWFLFTLAAARQRAETGFPMVPAMPTLPRYSLMFGGSAVWGDKAGIIGNHFFPIGTGLVSTLLPSTLEVIALAQRQRVTLKRLAVGMFVAAVVAFAVSMPMLLFWQYSQTLNDSTNLNWGGGKDAMYTYFRNYAGHIEWVRINASFIGMAVMAVLLLARTRVLGFPIHPIGYLVALQATNGYYFSNIKAGVNVIWGPMFVAWLIKRSVFKIGGAELFSRALPLFRGVVIGHFATIAVWALLRGVVPALYEQADVKLFFTW